MKINYVLLETGKYGVYVINEDLSVNSKIYTEDNKKYNRKDVNFEIIDYRKVPKLKLKLLKEAALSMVEICKMETKQKEIDEVIKELEKRLNEERQLKDSLAKSISSYNELRSKAYKNYKEETRIKELSKSISGNEILEMSFYHGTLDEIKAKAIIKKSNRPLTYTYGFSYRNPTTNHVKKTKEEAFTIIDTESFLDISFGEKEIHLNAYSANDMW